MSSSSEDSSSEDEEETIEEVSQFVPNFITQETEISTINFHPSRNLIATGNIEGNITINSYSDDKPETQQLSSFDFHTESCRALLFSEDGNLLFSGSVDKSIKIIDVTTGKLTKTLEREESSPIYSVLPINNFLVASGDEDGCFTLWDYRKKTAVMEEKKCEEYISSLCLSTKKNYVLATSGEGTLTCFNIRKKKMAVQSELFDSELLSSAFMKNDTKLVVGTGEGVLNIFDWGKYGNMSDRFPINEESIDSMIPLTDNILAIGSSDGKIKGINILPNQIVANIGAHSNTSILGLSLSHDKTFLASNADDNVVKFYNVASIINNEEKLVDSRAKRGAMEKKISKMDKGFFDGL